MDASTCLFGYCIFCFLILVSFSKDLHLKEPDLPKKNPSNIPVIGFDNYNSNSDHRRVARHMEIGKESALGNLVRMFGEVKPQMNTNEKQSRRSFLQQVMRSLKKRMGSPKTKMMEGRRDRIELYTSPVTVKITTEESSDEDDDDDDSD